MIIFGIQQWFLKKFYLSNVLMSQNPMIEK